MTNPANDNTPGAGLPARLDLLLATWGAWHEYRAPELADALEREADTLAILIGGRSDNL